MSLILLGLLLFGLSLLGFLLGLLTVLGIGHTGIAVVFPCGVEHEVMQVLVGGILGHELHGFRGLLSSEDFALLLHGIQLVFESFEG